MHGRTLALLAGLVVLLAAPAAQAQVPGLPPIFPPSQEEPEEPKPKPEEPEEEPKPKPKPQPQPEQQPQPQPQAQPEQQPQPSGQQQPGDPPPPAPSILIRRPDIVLGSSIEITGRARPGATVALMAREPWNLDEDERVATTTAGPNGIYAFRRFKPLGNTKLSVLDGTARSKPLDVFVTPRLEMTWTQKRGRVEALLFTYGTALIGARGSKVHFYGFTSRRSRAGRRIGSGPLIVAETRDGKTLVGTFLEKRHKRRLQGLGYCVQWGGRFERPEWNRACGRRSMRF